MFFLTYFRCELQIMRLFVCIHVQCYLCWLSMLLICLCTYAKKADLILIDTQCTANTDEDGGIATRHDVDDDDTMGPLNLQVAITVSQMEAPCWRFRFEKPPGPLGYSMIPRLGSFRPRYVVRHAHNLDTRMSVSSTHKP
jgi:hypothetical protein